eukprot:TRINITY_DN27660_c0_g1_i1.p1 TRINITY_DN27660_c0_g1~~TRINITY_DN27660_c0_g1_i1.p1  ORF type:complete len:841 (+),score=147.43 TRINITY_DN27660_c0_g1_i1:256-2778(+)
MAPSSISLVPPPLPEAVVPFAQRLFAWFPEVLVSLGSPNLADHFEVSTSSGATLLFEENERCKLVQVKLKRRRLPADSSQASKNSLCRSGTVAGDCSVSASQAERQRASPSRAVAVADEESLSPFSRSRADGSSRKDRSLSPFSKSRQARSKQRGVCTNRCAGSRHAHAHAPPAAEGCQQSSSSPRDGSEALEVSPSTPGSPFVAPTLSLGSSFSQSALSPCSKGRSGSGATEATVNEIASGAEEQAQPGQPEATPEPKEQKAAPPPETEAPPAVAASASSTAAAAAASGSSDRRPMQPLRLPIPAAGTPRDQQPSPSGASARAGEEAPFPTLKLGEVSDYTPHTPARSHGGETQKSPQSPESTSTVPASPSFSFSKPPLGNGAPGNGLAPFPQLAGNPQTSPPGPSKALSLMERRKSRKPMPLLVTTPQSASSLSAGSPGLPDLHKLPPAILSLEECRRPSLPGAFPTRRTIIILDWDDTLCPTSWIRRILREHIADTVDWACEPEGWTDRIPAWFGQPLPDDPTVRDAMDKLQEAVLSVIAAAQKLGAVCIVTNAVNGWVGQTTKKWLPMLREYILGVGCSWHIPVLYGKQEYKQPKPGSMAASLAWVDDQGELMWWKHAAMLEVLTRLDCAYRTNLQMNIEADKQSATSASTPRSAQGDTPSAAGDTPSLLFAPRKSSKESGGEFLKIEALALEDAQWSLNAGNRSLVNLVSIGDSEAEMQSALLASVPQHRRVQASSFSSCGACKRSSSEPPMRLRSGGQPWLKTVKLIEAPTVDQMIEQLKNLAKCLPDLVAVRSHVHLTPVELSTASKATPGRRFSSGPDADRWLQRCERKQSM